VLFGLPFEFGPVYQTWRGRRISGAELGAELGLQPARHQAISSTRLVAMKFLDRHGDGPAAALFQHPGRFSLYLDQKKPALMSAGILVMLTARLFK